MVHPNILKPDSTVLVVVDIQEAFLFPIDDAAAIASKTATAIKGFLELGLPIIVTEQYPKGLGHTVDEIKRVLPDDFDYVEKSSFSSCGAESFLKKLEAASTKQILLCGLETHICVNQTAHDLLNRGFEVHLLTDCVGSRFTSDREAGIRKMELSGVIPSSVEMALFELMRDAKHEKFKAVQNLIK